MFACHHHNHNFVALAYALHSDQQSESVLNQDWVLMQAKMGNKDWVRMKGKERLGLYEGKRRTERLGSYAE